MPVQEIFILPFWLLWSAKYNYFYQHHTLFHFMCPHRPSPTWTGSRAGPPVFEYMSPRKRGPYPIDLPVNSDGAGEGEGDGMTRSAGCTHPVGGGCGGPVPVHVTAVCQQAVRRIAHRVLIQSGRHSRVAAAYCDEKNVLALLL